MTATGFEPTTTYLVNEHSHLTKMTFLVKGLSVCLGTKWLWVWIPLLLHNPVSFLWWEKTPRKYSILMQVNHDICNQMLLINQ